VLDASDAEALKLLLSIDPLAQLADYDQQVLEQIRAVTASDSEALQALWDGLDQSRAAVEETLSQAQKTRRPHEPGAEQYLIIIECGDERAQVKLLRQLKRQGLNAAAKIA
jgi:hypothetical protein